MLEFQPEGMAAGYTFPPNLQEPATGFRMQMFFPKDPILLSLALQHIRRAASVEKSFPSLFMQPDGYRGKERVPQGFAETKEVHGPHLRLESGWGSA